MPVSVYTFSHAIDLANNQMITPIDGGFLVCTEALTQETATAYRPLTVEEKAKGQAAQAFYDKIMNDGFDLSGIVAALGGQNVGTDLQLCLREIRKTLRSDGIDGTIADEKRQIEEALGLKL
jgi:hypothetical protein